MYKIMIVEDEPGIREAVARQLQSWDMDVRIVTDFRKVTAEFADSSTRMLRTLTASPFRSEERRR